MPSRDFSTPMPELRLAELLGALSYALDMVEGCASCCRTPA